MTGIADVGKPDLEMLDVKGVSPKDAYRHLVALCHNSNNFGISIYEDPVDEDFEHLTIADAKASALQRKARGCIIGTVRLLPNKTGTTIQFVHKDANWNTPVINPDLWRSFIDTSKEYFAQLQDAQPTLNTATRAGTEKLEKPKRKGRYRLTASEVKFRREKVKAANKIKSDNPQKLWRDIDQEFANELDIKERTFRAWRHTNY